MPRYYSEQVAACRIDIDEWIQRCWPDSPEELLGELVDNLTPMSGWEVARFGAEMMEMGEITPDQAMSACALEYIVEAANLHVHRYYDNRLKGPCCEQCGKPLPDYPFPSELDEDLDFCSDECVAEWDTAAAFALLDN